MLCPKCPAVEMKTQPVAGIEIQRCENCHGMWLDAGELERLVRRPPRDLLQSDQAFAAQPNHEGPRINCPACQGTYLIKLNSRIRPGTIVDSCHVCFGVWLDAGELARLTGQELHSTLGAIFKG